jgi:ATP-dependent Clp protease ATP-binding subunit ClpX
MIEADEVKAQVACTFCLKGTEAVETMVAGPGVFICNECVGLCVDLMANKPADPPSRAAWEQQLTDDGLLDLLPKIAAASEQVDQQLAGWVRKARDRDITWTRIGAALSMTRQSAWERFSGEE